ncbi:VanZ family protein [Halopseudomonas pertucinogena]|uniref:VanZ family protein n=1 Tax=Halopseudomonas pertucinogena TaxID=86175 RepID=A0ABQ2CN10_9GAMM|nr:VanZ family protein [Halopseudomonas pertucinogena]GGI97045.1 hypothetical protein GCM10009083_12130 [Halopseudomonas pertucinogena]
MTPDHFQRFRWFYLILFYTVLGLGIYLGIRPEAPPTPIRFSSVDTVYHAGGLLVCTILSYPAHPRWRWWWRGLFLFGVGVVIECIQGYSSRTPDMADIYANTGGVLAGLAVLWAGRKIRWSRGTHPPQSR